MSFKVLFISIVAVFFGSIHSLMACTPYGTPQVTQNIVGTNLNITVTSTTSWSCDYEFELELICNAAAFTGNANHTRPQTPTISKPNTNNLDYAVYTIDISNLCPGTTYKYRVREKQLNYSYWSNWSAINTFTVPGPAYTVDVDASPDLICPPDCSNLTATSQNNCGPVTYTWSPNVGTGANQTVCPTATTTYTVTGSVNVPLCPIPITETASVTVDIQPPAVSGTATISDNVICEGETVTLSLNGYTGDIQWQSSTNSGGPFTDIPGATTDVYETDPLTQDLYFQAHVSTCTDEYSNIVNVQVTQSPTPDFSFSDICLEENATFTDLSTDNNSVDAWDWDFGDGNTSNVQNPTHTYGAPGDYDVELFAYNPDGCVDSITQQITVYPLPVADFDATTVCENLDTDFTENAVVAAPSSITNYEWDMTVNGTVDYTSQNPSHSFGTYGTFSVQLNVTTDAGCTHDTTKTVDVHALPVVDFDDSPTCLGETTDFQDLTNVPDGAAINSWDWDFDDGNTATIADPSNTYGSSGQYDVSLVIETGNGCVDSIENMVEISPLPTADFTVADDCFYDQLQFQNTSSANSSSFEWDFGDGNTSTDENPSHNYNSPGVYDVELIIATGASCGDTIEQTAVAYAAPAADFTVDPVCLNNTSAFQENATITPVDGDQINSYEWDFDDGNTSVQQSPSHTYMGEGVFDVSLIVTSNYGCKDTANVDAVVWPLPEVDFDPTDVCLGENSQFSDQTQLSNQFTTNNAANWEWDFDDGNQSTQQNPSHAYQAAGDYDVELTVTSNNGCVNDNTLTVTVHPTPEASFSGQDLEGCSPICPAVVSTSTVSGTSTLINYEWTLSNGMSQDGGNAEFNECFDNTTGNDLYYGLSLTVTTDQGCTDQTSESNYIQVYHNPIASFYYTPEDIDVMDPTVSFSNSSSYADNYSWTFGDNQTSTAINPEHVYPNEGQVEYDVELIASTDKGCKDTARSVVLVKDRIIFYVPNTFTPDNDKFNELFQPEFTSGFDPQDYNLLIFNRWGEVVFESNDASVGWNGTYGAGSDRIVKEGTYVWKIDFKETMSDQRHTHTGHVNVLK